MSKITLTCAKCGKQFERYASLERCYLLAKGKSQKKIFCSRGCKNEAEAFVLPPAAISDYLSGQTLKTIAAAYGASEVRVARVIRDAGHAVRSRANSGSKNGMYGRTHTLEAVNKIRAANHRQFAQAGAREAASQRTANAMQSGKLQRVSKIEKQVASILEESKINFTHQKAFRDSLGRYSACADFYLPDLGAVLEVNGTYWHADSRFYAPNSLNETQLKNLKAYARKTAMYEQLGLKLLEVWEADLKSDAPAAVSKALS